MAQLKIGDIVQAKKEYLNPNEKPTPFIVVELWQRDNGEYIKVVSLEDTIEYQKTGTCKSPLGLPYVEEFFSYAYELVTM